MTTDEIAAAIVFTGAAAVHVSNRVQINRLKHLLKTRTSLLKTLIGASGAVTAEEVTEAGAALEQTVRRFGNPRLGERVDQEERRA